MTEADEAQTQALRGTAPLAEVLGIEVLEASEDRVRGRMAWREDLCTVGGVLHGGAIMAFADTLGSLIAFMRLEPGEITSTMESKTSFFRGLRGEGHLEAISEVLHEGRTTIVVRTDLTTHEGKPAGIVIQTQARIRPGG